MKINQRINKFYVKYGKRKFVEQQQATGAYIATFSFSVK